MQALNQGNDHEIEFHEIGIAIFHEIEIGIFHEIKAFCKIDQEIEKAPGPLEGHYFRLFSLTLPSLTYPDTLLNLT